VPVEHDVDLVVCMRLLAVGLRRDEHVHADLDAVGLVHDLVAALVGETLFRRLDVERVCGSE